MTLPLLIHGTARQYDRPYWAPLELLLGSDELCAQFMWMFDVELDDGTVLNAYKHRYTRCYFHLDDAACTFYYARDSLYGTIRPDVAIQAVFEDWECIKPTASEREALRVAIARAKKKKSARR